MRTYVALFLFGGLSLLTLLGFLIFRDRGDAAPQTRPPSASRSAEVPKLSYLPTAVGAPVTTFGRPLVTNLQIVDLDQDGLLDILYCEARFNSVRWIRQSPRRYFNEKIIARDIPGPAHVWAADVNGTGKLDVLVASMGQIPPNDDPIGSVVVLENVDNQTFIPHVLIENVARVAAVRSANLAGHTDGKRDLVVAHFGYNSGETRWMENLGDWKFESHVVNQLSGPEMVPVADYDLDGRDDFAVLISQEWEEIHLFRNRGARKLEESVLWGSTNEDYGSSGLETVDLNKDGKPDLIYTNGDAFDYAGYGSRPWHGVQWLENRGDGTFTFHRIGDMRGAYGPSAGDLDGDGDLDLVTVSCFAEWSDPRSISMMAWLNDGKQSFTPVILAHAPTHLVASAVGDLDGNGIPVIVTGGFHAYPPYDRLSNITLWRRR